MISGSIELSALSNGNHKRELERRLQQTRRLLLQITDVETIERLSMLVQEIEAELRVADESDDQTH